MKHVICTAQLHDGALSHAVARRLDSANYIFDDTEFQYEQGCLERPVVKETCSTRVADLLLGDWMSPERGFAAEHAEGRFCPRCRRGPVVPNGQSAFRHGC